MRNEVFLSKYEFLDQSNAIKRRQERLIQVRQQSKEMSAAILERVKREVKKQNEDIENRVLAEIRNYHLKELESRRQQYEKCISEINRQHCLQQINLHNAKLPNSRRKKIEHSSKKIEQAPSINPYVHEENNVVKKRKKPYESLITITSHEKDENHTAKTDNSLKLDRNIVVDSDEEREKNRVVKFHQNVLRISPEMQHETLETGGDGIRHKCKHRKNIVCSSNSVTKLSHPTTDCNLRNREKIMKSEIDEMYNHLVHDRIRVLEQKDKILSRQTKFLPNTISSHSLRFSEYFAQYCDQTQSMIRGCSISQATSINNETKLNEIKDDMERVELKKKLLKNELKGVEDRTTSDVIASEKCDMSDTANRKSSSTLPSSEEKSESSISNQEPLKKSPKNRVCPSPIPKASNTDDTNAHEMKKSSKLMKHRQWKRKSCSKKGVVVTVSKKQVVTENCSSSPAKQNHSSELSSSGNDRVENRIGSASPVKIVVNVLPTADCKIEIKNNDSNKRFILKESKKSSEKVKNWRRLFENDEKLTESSYYSPPEQHTKVQQYSPLQKQQNKTISPRHEESTKDIDYYIRKLLLMSPQSIENLNVSCDTTVEEELSTTFADSNSSNISSSRCEQSKEISSTFGTTKCRFETETSRTQDSTIESENDPDYIKRVLMECLKVATSNKSDLKLPPFTSINSTQDYKIFNSCSNERPTISPNLRHSELMNAAIQRLLPFYHNSLDDNIDLTQPTPSNFQEIKELLNQTMDDSDTDLFSTSVYLQKLISMSPFHSEAQNQRDIVDQTQHVEPSLLEHSTNTTKTEESSSKNHDSACQEQNNVSLPSVTELVEKGLISKAYALVESSKCGEEKEVIDEEEFLKKMLIVDISPKQEDGQDASDALSKRPAECADELSEVLGKDIPDTSSSDIRKELRLMGLNWMDTTLQRTLQASAINSNSSADDSAGPVRFAPTTSQNRSHHPKSSLLLSRNLSQHPAFINISPITVPDVQLSIPQCLRQSNDH